MKRRTFLFALLAPLALPDDACAAGPSPIDPQGLRREVARRKGKVVVINFWATWCPPCKAEFPDLVRLYEKYRGRGLELLTVSLDDTSDAKKVAAFLAEQKLTAGTFLNRNGAEMDPGYLTWLEPRLPDGEAIGIPRTYIFDRRGKLTRALVGGQSAQQFEKAVASALK